MSIELRFVCGHRAKIGVNPTASPVCGCGETRVARTFARAPRFVGACSGPYAETKGLEPGVVNVATAGPLSLKREKSDG